MSIDYDPLRDNLGQRRHPLTMSSMHSIPASDSGSRAPDILGAIISTFCISILAVGLRTAARVFSKAGLWTDDCLIFAGTVSPLIGFL